MNYTITTKPGKLNPFYTYIKETFKGGEKFIPKEYKINDRKTRLKILAGLIDTDGYYSPNKQCYEYTSKDKRLAEDIRFLCRSLGVKCTLKQVQKSCGNFTGTYYRLYIYGNLTDCPVLVPRKKQTNFNSRINPEWYRIKIEELDVDNYYGFEIDGNSLFVLGDLTVTHNTSIALQMLNHNSKHNMHCYFSSYDMYKHNVYQKLIQKHTGYSEQKIFDMIKSQDNAEKFLNILNENYKNVSFCFRSGQYISEIKQSIAYQESKIGHHIDLVVVDYLELVLTKASDPTQASAEAAQGLREIANEGRTVVMLLQPNKLNSQPNTPLLNYSSAKGSSSISQAATSIVTMHRPGWSSVYPEDDEFMSFNCVKNRNGALFALDFGWDGPTQTVYNLDDSQIDKLKEVRERVRREQSGDNDDI